MTISASLLGDPIGIIESMIKILKISTSIIRHVSICLLIQFSVVIILNIDDNT
jgi:hypothetical protein